MFFKAKCNGKEITVQADSSDLAANEAAKMLFGHRVGMMHTVVARRVRKGVYNAVIPAMDFFSKDDKLGQFTIVN